MKQRAIKKGYLLDTSTIESESGNDDQKVCRPSNVTPASSEAAAKARLAKKVAACAIKYARAELKAAARTAQKVLAAERKVISAEAQSLVAKAKHEAKMLVAMAKLETKLAKAALKGLGRTKTTTRKPASKNSSAA